ncbi:hypothetical protein MMC14_005703 [Varicellaria rhodocarpa]|nr:hypothetical protein [Varicellaria rhodocarpa]
MSRETHASSHPRDHDLQRIQLVDQETHPVSNTTENQSPYYRVDRSGHYTTAPLSSSETRPYETGSYSATSGTPCAPLLRTEDTSVNNYGVARQYQTGRYTPTVPSDSSHRQQFICFASAFENTRYHQTFNLQTYNPIQRWENETMQEQTWNGIEYYRATSDTSTPYERNQGCHANEATSTGAQRGTGSNREA